MENTNEGAPAPAPASPITGMKTSTAKDFFLWLGFIISFFSSVSALITLIFSYINIAYPDTLAQYDYSGDYAGAIPYAMAMLIVMAPVAAILMHLIRRSISKDASRETFWVRRWAVIFTIFISGSVIVGDLITLLTSFLNGDISSRFLLKVTVLLLLALAILLHFIADSWGYWLTNRHKANSIGIAALVLCTITIGAGFLLIGSPTTIRLQNFDSQKVNDLNSIQGDVVNYAEQHQHLPTSVNDLRDPSAQFGNPPSDPQSKLPYEYRVLSNDSYELCAVFNKPTSSIADTSASDGTNDHSFWHGKGTVCFPRTYAFTPALKDAASTTSSK